MEDRKKLENKRVDAQTKVEVKDDNEKEKDFVSIKDQYPPLEKKQGGGFG